MSSNHPVPSTVVVPDNDAMANEPALEIGSFFADKKLVKTYVVAALSLFAYAFKFTIDSDQVENIVTLISGLGTLAAVLMAQHEASKHAKQQAAQTRDVVYAPATAAKLAKANPDEIEVVGTVVR